MKLLKKEMKSWKNLKNIRNVVKFVGILHLKICFLMEKEYKLFNVMFNLVASFGKMSISPGKLDG